MLHLMRYVLTVAILPPLFLIPGWMWLRRAGLPPLLALYCGVLPMMLAGAAIAALGVALPWGQGATGTVGLVVILGSAVWSALTAPRPLGPEPREFIGVLVWVALFIAVASFTAVPSRGAFDGQSYNVPPERVETPRLPGAPSDSYLPYRTGQLAIHKIGGEQLTGEYHPGWWISDRTPLNGLVFAFTASALHVPVASNDLLTLPASEDRMTTFDPFGYWAYQLTSMLLGTAAILAVFLFAITWKGGRVATVAALLFALMPGVFIYAIYPRPALSLAYLALVALVLVLHRRYWLAGAALGACYLTHPSGGVWIFPAIALVLLGTTSVSLAGRVSADPQVGARQKGVALAELGGAAAALALPWLLFTSRVVHASSRMLAWPLGGKLVDPTRPGESMRIAWDAFVQRGVAVNLWTRLVALGQSIFPVTSLVPVATGAEVESAWLRAHGLAAWGLIGVVLFPIVIVAVAHCSSSDRRLLLWLVGLPVAANLVTEGFPESFAYQSLFPALGILAVVTAAWMVTWRRRSQVIVGTLIIIELATVVWGGGMFKPFNLDIVPLVLCISVTTLALGAIAVGFMTQLGRGGSRLWS